MIEPEWIMGLIGGVIIGAASALLLLFNGRIFGVSGIVGGGLKPSQGDTAWRLLLVVGFLLGGVLFRFVDPAVFPETFPRTAIVIGVAGILVGFGSRLGNGCTSGHGVCGVARLSPRSLVATGIFTFFGALTVYVIHHLLGGAQ